MDRESWNPGLMWRGEGVAHHLLLVGRRAYSAVIIIIIIIYGGEDWLGFPDLWSGQNPDGTDI